MGGWKFAHAFTEEVLIDSVKLPLTSLQDAARGSGNECIFRFAHLSGRAVHRLGDLCPARGAPDTPVARRHTAGCATSSRGAPDTPLSHKPHPVWIRQFSYHEYYHMNTGLQADWRSILDERL